MVLDAQLLSFCFSASGLVRVYRQTRGITTGLACANQLANSYLAGMDAVFNRAFGILIYSYKRFVDDICVIHNPVLTVDLMLEVFNGFAHDVFVTHDLNEDPLETHFLDLNISLTDSVLEYATLWKPECTYNYVPWSSCLPRESKLVIVAGEVVRFLRTNSCESSFDDSVAHFASKLLLRGYDAHAIRRVIERYPWHSKTSILARNQTSLACKKRIVPFKVHFAEYIDTVGISTILNRHLHLLDESLQDSLKIVQCFRSFPNMFRLRFHRFCVHRHGFWDG